MAIFDKLELSERLPIKSSVTKKESVFGMDSVIAPFLFDRPYFRKETALKALRRLGEAFGHRLNPPCTELPYTDYAVFRQ